MIIICILNTQMTHNSKEKHTNDNLEGSPDWFSSKKLYSE